MKKFLSLLAIASLIFLGCPNPSGEHGSQKTEYEVRIMIEQFETFTRINAHVWDNNYTFNRDSSVTVNGEPLVLHSVSNFYSKIIFEKIIDGTSIPYTIETPDGVETSGSIIMPSGTVGDVTYTPNDTIATESLLSKINS